ITSNFFNGTGGPSDLGIAAELASNVTIQNNLFQFEALAMEIVECQFIAVLSNTIGNVTFPTNEAAVLAVETVVMSITSNTIQMANSSSTVSIEVIGNDLNSISNNVIW